MYGLGFSPRRFEQECKRVEWTRLEAAAPTTQTHSHYWWLGFGDADNGSRRYGKAFRNSRRLGSDDTVPSGL